MEPGSYVQVILFLFSLVVALFAWILKKLANIETNIAVAKGWQNGFEDKHKENISRLDTIIRNLEEETKRARERLHKLEGSFILKEATVVDLYERMALLKRELDKEKIKNDRTR